MKSLVTQVFAYHYLLSTVFILSLSFTERLQWTRLSTLLELIWTSQHPCDTSLVSSISPVRILRSRGEEGDPCSWGRNSSCWLPGWEDGPPPCKLPSHRTLLSEPAACPRSEAVLRGSLRSTGCLAGWAPSHPRLSPTSLGLLPVISGWMVLRK